ncbi:MAG: glycosyltransferase [Nocardioides sp.]|nr:glycosyltransferase [Nocardioides sp.]
MRDVDWWYSPDPDSAWVITGNAQRQGGRTIFDIHEVYHRGLLNRWWPGGEPPQIIRRTVQRIIAKICSRVDLVLGVNEAVLSPYAVSGSSTLVVRNCAPFEFSEEQRIEEAADGPVGVMHGKVSSGNGTSQVIRAAQLLESEVSSHISIRMLRRPEAAESAFDRQVASMAAELPHDAVVLQASVSHAEMPRLMSQCTVGMIAYQRDLGIESLPNRFFEYMASGLAVLAPSYSTGIVAIIESEQIGITADFEDPASIAASLTWLARHPTEVREMGNRAREAFLKRHNWDTEAAILIDCMNNM